MSRTNGKPFTSKLLSGEFQIQSSETFHALGTEFTLITKTLIAPDEVPCRTRVDSVFFAHHGQNEVRIGHVEAFTIDRQHIDERCPSPSWQYDFLTHPGAEYTGRLTGRAGKGDSFSEHERVFQALWDPNGRPKSDAGSFMLDLSIGRYFHYVHVFQINQEHAKGSGIPQHAAKRHYKHVLQHWGNMYDILSPAPLVSKIEILKREGREVDDTDILVDKLIMSYKKSKHEVIISELDRKRPASLTVMGRWLNGRPLLLDRGLLTATGPALPRTPSPKTVRMEISAGNSVASTDIQLSYSSSSSFAAAGKNSDCEQENGSTSSPAKPISRAPRKKSISPPRKV